MRILSLLLSLICITQVLSEETCDLMAAINVLFVGNSFTIRNKLTAQLEKLGKSGKQVIRASMAARPSATFSSHSSSIFTEEMIQTPDRRWDVVVLQEQSSMFANPEWKYRTWSYPFSKILQEKCDGYAESIVLYDTWGYRYGQPSYWNSMEDDFYKMSDRIAEGYGRTNERLNENMEANVFSSVAGVNKAWKLAYPKFQRKLFNSDGFHPAKHGTYLTACVFYKKLTGKSPVGLRYKPRGISRRNARRLQIIANSV